MIPAEGAPLHHREIVLALMPLGDPAALIADVEALPGYERPF